MSDPLSVAGSVVGLVSLGIQVSERLVQFYTSVQDSRGDVQSTRAAIEELGIILKSITNAIGTKREQFSPEEVQLIESSVLSCQGGIERLEMKLNKIFQPSGTEKDCSQKGELDTPKSSSRTGWSVFSGTITDSRGRFLYPFKESTLAKLRETVKETKENLLLSLQLLNL